MNNDPFYQQIIERLNNKLDPDVFEQCVTDLLREVYPGLVPVPGGQDSGTDGEIADGNGHPFPLIVTTQTSVITNLAKSLQSYIKGNGPRKLAVLATSQFLTPKKRKNLFDKASEIGFTLENIHGGDDIANRLYHNPKWCKELLNLTGKPSALSIFPKSDRLILNQKLIGRQEDYKWLLDSQGDRLLIGQPGSGKSFLLHRYAIEGNALFVVDNDREAIANGIRLQQPSVLIIDDVQIHLALLADLKQIRQELRSDFSILASCWVGDQSIVKGSMNLTSSQTHELDLLPRSQIVDLIHDIGLGGPDRLIHEIVNQSSGRPGLAATLAHLSLQGEVKDVLLGDILSNSIRQLFVPRLGNRTVDIMSAFSIGGEKGMKMDAVASACQLSIVDVHVIVTELGAGGVLWDRSDGFLSIHPDTLRHALVRDVFFNQKYPLPIQSFIDHSPNLKETARTLIGARYRGAKIPDDFLLRILEQTQSNIAWQEYASLGAKESTWVLTHHTELTCEIAQPALFFTPKLAIQKLFKLSIGDRRSLHSSTDHPLRIIEDWVKQALPGSKEAVDRRNLLITAAIDWLRQGNEEEVGIQAIQSAYNPIFQDFTTSPGNDDLITIRHAYLYPTEMAAIQDRWSETIETLKLVKRIPWKYSKAIVHSWAYPELHDINLPASTRKSMRSFASRVLMDLISLEPTSQGLLHWGKQISRDADLNVSVNINPEFETLYPVENRENWSEHEKKAILQVKRLASSWSKLNPNEVARKLSQFEVDASSQEIRWPRYTPFLCFELSLLVENIIFWVNSFIDNVIPGDLVFPLLKKASKDNTDGWTDVLNKCIERDEFIQLAISIALTSENTPGNLLEGILGKLTLTKSYQIISTLCLQQEVPEETLKRLLLHDDPNIASEAAKGMWFSQGKKTWQRNLESEWQKAAILSNDEHFLSSILANNSNLSCQWLSYIFGLETIKIINFDNPIRIAARALSVEHKLQILKYIPARFDFGELIEYMIRDDLALFEALLQNERLTLFHLIPLYWDDSERWIVKAKLALEKGYSAQQIASAVYGYPLQVITWSGNESIIRREWVTKFEKLCECKDDQIQEIGYIGKKFAEENLKAALKREKEDEIFGNSHLY